MSEIERTVYYRLSQPEFFELIKKAAINLVAGDIVPDDCTLADVEVSVNSTNGCTIIYSKKEQR